MKTYIGTKIIQAEPAPAPDDVKGDNQPGDDGYKVVYPDGYESWSPKAVFEEAYAELGKYSTLTGLSDFGKTVSMNIHVTEKGVSIVFKQPLDKIFAEANLLVNPSEGIIPVAEIVDLLKELNSRGGI